MNCANHPDRERVAFCQNCGKPLCSECMRPVGAAVFCEPCLEARLAAADAAAAGSASASGTPYGNVNVPPAYAGAPPPASGASNPFVAGALGLIPGVGAMYNGQYAKGVIHLVIFALLVSLTDNNGIFGLFVAGWVIYQAIEAYHTAQARRAGTPLPNPFGLNEIGDRFGFGKSWAGGPPNPASGSFTPRTDAAQGYGAASGMPFEQTGAASHYGAPVTPPPPSYGYTQPPAQPFGQPFVPVNDPSLDPALNSQKSSFPTGAVVLIGLGLLFFFGSSGFFQHFPVQRIIPFILIAVGVWLFVRKMTNTGIGLADDGSPAYQIRLFRALRSSVWVILVGVLFLLDTFDILSWGKSWPLFIIVGGLMTFFERSAYSAAAAATPYAYPPASAAYPSAPYNPPATSTAIVPASPRDEEGR
jgi:hypothetical protein